MFKTLYWLQCLFLQVNQYKKIIQKISGSNDTVVLDYYNSSNAADIDFSTGIEFRLRLNARFIDAFSNDSTAIKPMEFRNFTINASGQQYNTARTTFFNNMNIQRRLPFKYDEKTDIQFQLRTSTGTYEMNVFGEGILKDN